jgi:hypothetical protein
MGDNVRRLNIGVHIALRLHGTCILAVFAKDLRYAFAFCRCILSSIKGLRCCLNQLGRRSIDGMCGCPG